MKTKLFSIALLAVIQNGMQAQQTDANGYTTVEASMGATYANRLFFDLSENQLTSQPANTWDIAFWRNSAMQLGTRINDAKNILVYQVSTDIASWDSIDVSNIGNWGTPLYNPDQTTDLSRGALETSTINTACSGAFNMGWGCYNIATHEVEGKVIFVLKYSDQLYYKLFIEKYYGGYTFKYAKYDGTAWGETITKTVANGNADQYFNYFSFDNNEVVTNMEPSKNQWDLMFTRYWTFYNNVMMYRMSGVIQSPRITVAKTSETQETSAVNLPDASAFSSTITTIGHSWKPTSGLIPNVVYYIKENDQYYRLYFTQNGGASTGNMYFKYKNITENLSTSEIDSKINFGLYPNPAPNKQVTLLYDNKNALDQKGLIQIYDFSGKKVYETEISKSAGFYQKELHLSHLNAGTYLVTLKIGHRTETKKLIIK